MDSKPPIATSRGCLYHSRKFWSVLAGTLLVAAIGLGVGLGVGLTRDSSSNDDASAPSNTPSVPLSPTNTTNVTGTWWKPTAGTTWQIVLLHPPTDTNINVSVYDIDLFDNSASTIDVLHAQNKKVICYFSAGTYESNRPDSALFSSVDKGKELPDWPGEYWLNTTSPAVRSIMLSRLQLAKSKGCDGVDPDNVDAYDNANGFSLQASDAIDYLTFLAGASHGLGLAIGLKNGGKIVENVLGLMEWEVNEQCGQFGECSLFRSFIEEEKPVFHIEYVKGNSVDFKTKSALCGENDAKGFSTVIKEMDLGDWVADC